MAVFCKICNSSNQQTIEAALLAGTPIDEVAKSFEVPLNDLKIHAVMHLSAFKSKASADGSESSVEPEESLSIAQKLKLQEAVTLRNTYNEYYSTLKKLGAHINRQITESDKSGMVLGRLLEKSTIDLYLGAGVQIRETIKSLAEIDSIVNGKEDSSAGSIAALVSAIRGSSTTGKSQFATSSESAFESAGAGAGVGEDA